MRLPAAWHGRPSPCTNQRRSELSAATAVRLPGLAVLARAPAAARTLASGCTTLCYPLERSVRSIKSMKGGLELAWHRLLGVSTSKEALAASKHWQLHTRPASTCSKLHTDSKQVHTLTQQALAAATAHTDSKQALAAIHTDTLWRSVELFSFGKAELTGDRPGRKVCEYPFSCRCLLLPDHMRPKPNPGIVSLRWKSSGLRSLAARQNSRLHVQSAKRPASSRVG